MSKKDRKDKRIQRDRKKEVKFIGISKRGRKIIISGIGVLLLGFLVLTRTDPAGQNWASVLSPFLIIGGYVIIGIGIIVPDRPAAENPPDGDSP